MSARTEYEKLVIDLHREIHAGRGDGAVADRLRDQMDMPWFSLSEAERAQLQYLSEDLYELGGERSPVALGQGENVATLLEQAKHTLARQPDRTLAMLRKIPDGVLPKSVRFYMMARCLDQLGYSREA